MIPRTIRSIAVGIVAVTLASCASRPGEPPSPPPIPVENVPALSFAVAIVAVDVRTIVESESPTHEQFNQLLLDMGAILPLVADDGLRRILSDVITGMRAAVDAGFLIKAVVEGNLDELRAIRDRLSQPPPRSDVPASVTVN